MAQTVRSVKASEAEWAAWSGAAVAAGVTVNAWCRAALNAAVMPRGGPETSAAAEPIQVLAAPNVSGRDLAGPAKPQFKPERKR